VPAKGAQAAGQRAPSLRLALLYSLAGLEGCGAQLQQLLLGGVVGGLQRLGTLGRVPQRGASKRGIRKGGKPSKGKSVKQKTKQ
jgi:hypothetical protein